MKSKYNLTTGAITGKLFLVAAPLMGSQLLQMVYNLTDMFWLGRLSSDAVAASGIVGFYLWLSVAFFLFGRMGAEIGVSQNIGKGDTQTAEDYARNALLISIALGVAIAIIYYFARSPLIGLFGIQEAHVATDARSYLAIVAFGQPFVFVSMAISGIFAGAGNTRVPLVINLISFGFNMLLDPILIFPAGLGIQGAAIATITANVLGAILSIIALYKIKNRPFKKILLFKKPDFAIVRQIFKWVTPVSLESFLFTSMSIFTNTFIAAYGAGALTAARVSSQIESLTWLIAAGFATAMTTFTGQNYGAGKWGRIGKGFNAASLLMLLWGAIVTLLLYFGGGVLLRVFIPNNPEIVEIGIRFLKILAIIQIPACLEGVTAGVFRGLGKTLPPSITSISSNILRALGAFIAAGFTDFGLYGIWSAIAISSGLRGAVIFAWYVIYSRKLPKTDALRDEA